MRKPPAPAAHSARTVAVLCVDPSVEDCTVLQSIFDHSTWSLCPDSFWSLRTSPSLKSAWSLLRSQLYPVVLCEYDLCPGTWRELFGLLGGLAAPPFLIVTSRAADERLWAEALNLGAYDVLAKPFDATEVMRVVSMAWLHWNEQHGAGATTRLAAGVAG